MEIREEFERLQSFVSTDSGWNEVEKLWMNAMNYVQSGEGWEKMGPGFGMKVVGFAIDPVTFLHKVGVYHHYEARLELKMTLIHQDVDDYERILDGRMGTIEGWEYPFIFLFGKTSEIESSEEKIVELGLGLPIAGLFHKKLMDKAREK